MKIIEATWEKPNLDCDAYEIILELSDLEQWEYVAQSIQKLLVNDNYVVIKTPRGNFQLNKNIAKLGFYFAEVLYLIKLDFKKYELSKIHKHFCNRCSFKILDKNYELWKEKIINKISTFNTDRISLDPRFGTEIGNLRYKNWLKNSFDNENSQAILFYYNEKEVGFAIDVWDKEEKVIASLFGATFSEYLGGNLLGVSLSNLYLFYKNQNFKYLTTNVSSNNLNSLSIHLDLSHKIYDSHNVFVSLN